MGTEHLGEATYTNGENDNRMVGLVWMAYSATRNRRYRELATDFLDDYVRRLDELGDEEPHLKKYLGGFIYNHQDPRMHFFTDVRYHFTVSSMVNPLLDAFRVTGDRKYLAAARKFLEPALPDSLHYWVGNKESSALAEYRCLSGDHFADRMVLDWVERARDYPDDLFSYVWRPLGDAKTEWDWMHMHWVRTHPAPTTYRLAYDISGDEGYLNRALEGAIDRATLLYAQQSRPETRHGQERATSLIYTNDWDWRLYWLAFEIVDVLFPMAGRHYPASGEYSDALCGYDVRFSHENGSIVIPETIALIYCRTRPDRRLVEFYNAGEAAQTILVEPHDFLYTKLRSAKCPGGKIVVAGNRVTLTLPPHSKAVLDMALAK